MRSVERSQNLAGGLPMPKLQYEVIRELSRDEVADAVRRGDPEELLYAVLSVALHDNEPEFAESFCVEYSVHPHPNVRGNSVLGFGHIARIHGKLNIGKVKPIIIAALSDEDEYVRGQADNAKEDTEFFLKWRY